MSLKYKFNSSLDGKFIHSFVFEFDGKNYLYDYVNDFVCIISSKFKKTLEKYYGGILEKENIEEMKLLEFFFERNIVASDSFKLEKIKDDFDDVYMSFAPIYECNFRCRYCFGKYGKKYKGKIKAFSKEMVKKTIDYFVFEAFPNASDYHIDFVSGGEPLLNFDVIVYAVSYAEELKRKKNKRIKIWLCTNSKLLNEKVCGFLDKHNISIGISIDGVDEQLRTVIQDNNQVWILKLINIFSDYL